MELHKNISIDKNKYQFSLTDDYFTYFAKALDFTLTYYKEDFDRIAGTRFSDVSAEFFFREYIWCVQVSGFNAKIISGLFPRLLDAYKPLFDMIEGKIETVNSIDVSMNALSVFNNKRKCAAVIDTAFKIRDGVKNWQEYRNNELNVPQKLEQFKMVGPVISLHLARNLGILNYVKPDLHLKRLAANWNFRTPEDLCKAIQERYNMPLGLIDLCLFYVASSVGSKK